MRSPLITLLAALPLLAACQSGNDAFFPANKSKNVNPDTHLTITFDATPTLGESGFIRVYDAATDALVDELDMSIPAAPPPLRARMRLPQDPVRLHPHRDADQP